MTGTEQAGDEEKLVAHTIIKTTVVICGCWLLYTIISVYVVGACR